MTREQKNLLFSMCFGDGCARERTNGTTAKLYGEFALTHCKKQQPYLEWKLDLLHSIIGGKRPKVYEWVRKRKIGGVSPFTTEVCFKKVHPYFKVIRRMMYKKGVKTFSRPVLNRLSLLGIMMWYLDDGNLAPIIRGGKLRTYHVQLIICRPFEEMKQIRSYFKEVWGITWVINKHGKTCHKLRMGKTKGGEEFIKTLYPLVKRYVPSMLYKVDVNLSPRVQNIQIG